MAEGIEDIDVAEEPEVEGEEVALDDESAVKESDHFANIVDDLDQLRLGAFAVDLLELVERDKESRKRRDELYAEGIRRTGLGNDAPGGAQFDGASKVVHPMLTEATIDFSSKAMKELFPAKGPAKSFIPGTATKERIAKAERKAKHLNWQLTVQMRDFRAELEQLLTQTSLAGVQYLKLGWNARKRRPTALFVPLDDVYLPFAATNYYTAERRTHRQEVTRQLYEGRVESGMYRDVDLVPASQEPEQSEAAKATDRVEGRTSTSYNEDGLREVYEVSLEADLEDDDKRSPYIITVDKTSTEVLSVYRNWMPEDEDRNELFWMIEFPFVPWRGAYPIGLTHMIGGMSGAATGALRALLDSAHINNFPGAVKLKGGGKGGASEVVQPTQITELEGSIIADDIRKTIMPMPFNPPSTVLFSLLGFLVDAGKGVVRTTFENVADGHPNMPVGTTMALIDQGMTVYSAIHGRLHDAMQRTLEVLHRINYMYLEDGELKDDVGEVLASRSDYEGPADVVPVSDPNIFSETQRFMQVQAVVARSDMHPELYEQRSVELMLLERLKVQDFEKLLRRAPTPRQMNAVNENVAASMGQPVTAFPEQDHLAHLQAHLSFIESPMLGSSILMAGQTLPLLLGHVREHVALWYVSEVYRLVEEASGVPPESLKTKDPATEAMYDRVLALAGSQVAAQAAQVFAKVPPIVDAAIKLSQSLAPPMPQDPTVAAAQASGAETQRKTAEAQQKGQLKTQEMQQKGQLKTQEMQQSAQLKAQEMQQRATEAQTKLEQAQADNAQEAELARMREDAAMSREMAALAARMTMNREDNETAMRLAEMELAYGEKFAVSTGTGVNPGTR